MNEIHRPLQILRGIGRVLPLAAAAFTLFLPAFSDAASRRGGRVDIREYDEGQAPRSYDAGESTSFVSYVENDFMLVANGGDIVEGSTNTPVLPGDRIETSRGRVEAVLADGTVLRIDRGSKVSFEALANTAGDSSDRTALRLEEGSIFIQMTDDATEDDAFLIDTFGVRIQPVERGLYRVDSDRNGKVLVHVRRGEAEIRTRSNNETISDGEWAVYDGDDVDGDFEVVRHRYDDDNFDRWCDERMSRSRRTYKSAKYLDGNFSYAYDSFDDNGSWLWADDYDRYVWRPRVSFSWRPYSDGRWCYTPAGLSWYSSDPWGWVPYHYGSWMYSSSIGWCWGAGYSYSPAWVYWYHTPGYIGWCPTGYYDSYYSHNWGWGRTGYGSGGWGHGRGSIGFGVSFNFNFSIGAHNLDRAGWSFLPQDRIASSNIRGSLLTHDALVRNVGRNARGVVSSEAVRFEGSGARMSGGAVARALTQTPERLLARASSADSGMQSFFRRERELPRETVQTLERQARTLATGEEGHGREMRRGRGSEGAGSRAGEFGGDSRGRSRIDSNPRERAGEESGVGRRRNFDRPEGSTSDTRPRKDSREQAGEENRRGSSLDRGRRPVDSQEPSNSENNRDVRRRSRDSIGGDSSENPSADTQRESRRIYREPVRPRDQQDDAPGRDTQPPRSRDRADRETHDRNVNPSPEPQREQRRIYREPVRPRSDDRPSESFEPRPAPRGQRGNEAPQRFEASNPAPYGERHVDRSPAPRPAPRFEAPSGHSGHQQAAPAPQPGPRHDAPRMHVPPQAPQPQASPSAPAHSGRSVVAPASSRTRVGEASGEPTKSAD